VVFESLVDTWERWAGGKVWETRDRHRKEYILNHKREFCFIAETFFCFFSSTKQRKGLKCDSDKINLSWAKKIVSIYSAGAIKLRTCVVYVRWKSGKHEPFFSVCRFRKFVPCQNFTSQKNVEKKKKFVRIEKNKNLSYGISLKTLGRNDGKVLILSSSTSRKNMNNFRFFWVANYLWNLGCP
jgi:hypothetical protein